MYPTAHIALLQPLKHLPASFSLMAATVGAARTAGAGDAVL